MRTVSLKNIALVLTGVIAASASPAPTLTPVISTSSSDAGVTIESMPSVLTGTFTLPSGISQAPGPVIPSNTASGSGGVSVSTASSSTLTNSTSSGTGTTTSPASTTTPNGAGASIHANVLVTGLVILSAAGVQLL